MGTRAFSGQVEPSSIEPSNLDASAVEARQQRTAQAGFVESEIERVVEGVGPAMAFYGSASTGLVDTEGNAPTGLSHVGLIPRPPAGSLGAAPSTPPLPTPSQSAERTEYAVDAADGSATAAPVVVPEERSSSRRVTHALIEAALDEAVAGQADKAGMDGKAGQPAMAGESGPAPRGRRASSIPPLLTNRDAMHPSAPPAGGAKASAQAAAASSQNIPQRPSGASAEFGANVSPASTRSTVPSGLAADANGLEVARVVAHSPYQGRTLQASAAPPVQGDSPSGTWSARESAPWPKGARAQQEGLYERPSNRPATTSSMPPPVGAMGSTASTSAADRSSSGLAPTRRSSMPPPVTRTGSTPPPVMPREPVSGPVATVQAQGPMGSRRSVVSTTGSGRMTSFVANLGDIPMADLLTTIATGGKTGQITVRHDGTMSRLWIADGSVVDAESGPLTGEPAVFRILRVRTGELVAEFMPVERWQTVTTSLQGLLMQAAFREDQRLALHERLTQNGVYCMRTERGQGEVQPQNSAQVAVLALADGSRSLFDLVAASKHDELEALTAMDDLVKAGLLQVVPEPASPVSAPLDPTGSHGGVGRRSARAIVVRTEQPSQSPLAFEDEAPDLEQMGIRSGRWGLIWLLCLSAAALAAVWFLATA